MSTKHGSHAAAAQPRTDSFSEYEVTLAGADVGSPWVDGVFVPDITLLRSLVDIPVGRGASSESGRFAKALDSWAAHELRRAGFDEDEVWPRATRPRVLPADIAQLARQLTPQRNKAHLSSWLAASSKASSVAPVEARVLGRVYTKQADVLIASWSRGVELMISSKTMLSSYGKNLRNRFEESYGDSSNIKGRFPLAAVGYMFMVGADIPDSDRLFLIDMLSKLHEPSGYDACCLLVVDYEDGVGGTSIREDLMDEAFGPGRFFSDLVETVIGRTPVDHHVRVRERRVGAPLPIAEGEVTGEGDE